MNIFPSTPTGTARATRFKAVIVGAGPAGLTAAYKLSQAGAAVVVLESDPEYVGGISRTVHYKNFRFDIGGHRFFSKSREVEDLWTQVGGSDMLERPRSSRIYYRGEFYSYPLKPFEALSKLGVAEAARCLLSFAEARVNPTPNPKTFEDWVVNQFGERLFQIFFKTYTEKVWGMSCKEISADWAAQRIKGLSLPAAPRPKYTAQPLTAPRPSKTSRAARATCNRGPAADRKPNSPRSTFRPPARKHHDAATHDS